MKNSIDDFCRICEIKLEPDVLAIPLMESTERLLERVKADLSMERDVKVKAIAKDNYGMTYAIVLLDGQLLFRTGLYQDSGLRYFAAFSIFEKIKANKIIEINGKSKKALNNVQF